MDTRLRRRARVLQTHAAQMRRGSADAVQLARDDSRYHGDTLGSGFQFPNFFLQKLKYQESHKATKRS
ncbi:hypothetical protein NDU88_004732 [Pleurodeles waltl]|uniref:Uncharacterized protein n=1 Tax=Pleurodeles waltl TaxID=8319 RepID=A0AAV7VJL5_PLEWA|nr:hypothetical protein NDU88_004732 [Pleurodeles waltl]